MEAANLCHLFAVIHNAKVCLLEIRHSLAVLVRHRKYHIHFVGADADFRDLCVAASRIAGILPGCPGLRSLIGSGR